MVSSPFLPVFELTRGNVIESIHFGAVAIVDARGKLVASYGDPAAVTFLRSSAKPFQALPFIEHGGQQSYGLTLNETALICSSHTGTDEHVATVGELQAKAGVHEVELMCGTHAPLDHQTAVELIRRREEPTPNRHNCSGKHTGMLAYARLKGLPIPTTADGLAYIHPDHPIQQEILPALAEMCALSVGNIAIGIDGCSVPTFAIPLYNAALGFARLVDPETGQVGSARRTEACHLISQAMRTHPEMVAGPHTFDTLLMQAAGGKILSKGGAEGYLAMGLLPGVLGSGSPALGVALKISDGDLAGHSHPQGSPFGHARHAVALEVLRQLGALNPEAQEALAEFGPTFRVENWRKVTIGLGRPNFMLKREA